MQTPDDTPETAASLNAAEVLDAWPALSTEERLEALRLLPRDDAEDLFFNLSASEQVALFQTLPAPERRAWMRLLPPDDAADVLQAASRDFKEVLLGLLDETTRAEVKALMVYAEDEAGGLMNPRFAKLREDMKVEEGLAYLRKLARTHIETIYYIYVIDDAQHLKGVLSLREIFGATPGQRVADVMQKDVLTVPEGMDQEALSRLFKQHELVAMPVVDADGHIKGIVTVDDIVDVVEEEATEDIQKIGGSEALDAPYLATRFWRMIQKRAGWLSALFLGEMLTATAMSYFQDELQKAILLSLFVPLIISSGGNSGSQASTLVIRAMALGEVRLHEWARVVRRELLAGLVLGSILGVIGLIRIILWQAIAGTYGPHYMLIAFTVGTSLVGVVMFGTLAGSMLPFLLRALGLDPASASAPFVATLVDVSGLIIYFTAAAVFLGGVLL